VAASAVATPRLSPRPETVGVGVASARVAAFESQDLGLPRCSSWSGPLLPRPHPASLVAITPLASGGSAADHGTRRVGVCAARAEASLPWVVGAFYGLIRLPRRRECPANRSWYGTALIGLLRTTIYWRGRRHPGRSRCGLHRAAPAPSPRAWSRSILRGVTTKSLTLWPRKLIRQQKQGFCEYLGRRRGPVVRVRAGRWAGCLCRDTAGRPTTRSAAGLGLARGAGSVGRGARRALASRRPARCPREHPAGDWRGRGQIWQCVDQRPTRGQRAGGC